MKAIRLLPLTFVLAAFMPRLVRSIGKKSVYIYSSFITVAGGVIIFFAPAGQISGSRSRYIRNFENEKKPRTRSSGITAQSGFDEIASATAER